MKDLIEGLNISKKREDNYLFLILTDNHAYGYCSCGFKGEMEKDKRTCPKCGKLYSWLESYYPNTDRVNSKRITFLDITANSTYLYLKLFEINADCEYDKETGFNALSDNNTYIHEIFFGYEKDKNNKEKFVTKHLVNGEKIPLRKNTIKNLYSYYNGYDVCKLIDYDYFNKALQKLSIMDFKEYRPYSELRSESIWNLQYVYRYSRNLLKLNYYNVYVDTIEELKKLDEFIEATDKRLFEFVNEPLFKPDRQAYYLKSFLRPSDQGVSSFDELVNYYKEMLELSKIYPNKTNYALNALVKMKNKLEYTIEEIEELNRRIDNQAFENIPGRYGHNPLNLIYDAQYYLKELKLPSEKVPKELAIFVMKANALYSLASTSWSYATNIDSKKYHINCVLSKQIIKQLYDLKGFKILDDILVDFKMKDILFGKLIVGDRDAMNPKTQIYDNIFIQIKRENVTRYTHKYHILKMIEINEDNSFTEIKDKDQILNKLKELLESKEVACNG